MTDQPRLAPGLRVVARGRDRWQVGIDPGRGAVLPRTAAHTAVLEALQAGAPPPDDPASRSVVEALERRGLVVRRRNVRRPARQVLVQGTLGTDPRPVLADAGLEPASTPATAAAVLVLSAGEPDRDLLDPWVRAGLPHLVLRVVDGSVVLGPFVRPGETACLRCIDEHRADEDPEHLAVLDRYARASARPRRDGVPDPVDPVVVMLATCWAVRDLANHLDGVRPTTWSSTITLAPQLTDLTVAAWLRHPACACCWLPEAGPPWPGCPDSQGASGTLEW